MMLDMAPIRTRTTKNRYGLLLFALFCFISLSPLATDHYMGRLIFLVLFVFTILGAAVSAVNTRLNFWLLTVFGFASVYFNLIANGNLTLIAADKIFSLMFFLLAIWQFGQDIFVRREVSKDTLFGSVCIYFLMGAAFADIYSLVQLYSPAAIIFSATNVPVQKLFDYYYFSFSVLSTTGFGDIVANVQSARAVVIIEGLTGLFYLAILVAHLATISVRRE